MSVASQSSMSCWVQVVRLVPRARSHSISWMAALTSRRTTTDWCSVTGRFSASRRSRRKWCQMAKPRTDDVALAGVSIRATARDSQRSSSARRSSRPGSAVGSQGRPQVLDRFGRVLKAVEEVVRHGPSSTARAASRRRGTGSRSQQRRERGSPRCKHWITGFRSGVLVVADPAERFPVRTASAERLGPAADVAGRPEPECNCGTEARRRAAGPSPTVRCRSESTSGAAAASWNTPRSGALRSGRSSRAGSGRSPHRGLSEAGSIVRKAAGRRCGERCWRYVRSWCRARG